MSVIARFKVHSIQDHGGTVQVSAGAVYSNDPDSRNRSFADATPSAHLSIQISKGRPAIDFFKMNQVIEVTMDEVPADEWQYLQDAPPYPLGERTVTFARMSKGICEVDPQTQQALQADAVLLEHRYDHKEQRYIRTFNPPLPFEPTHWREVKTSA